MVQHNTSITIPIRRLCEATMLAPSILSITQTSACWLRDNLKSQYQSVSASLFLFRTYYDFRTDLQFITPYHTGKLEIAHLRWRFNRYSLYTVHLP